MKKLKMKPKIKQLQAIAKALSKAVVSSSVRAATGKIKQENLNKEISERIKEIQRKYGIENCQLVFPDIAKKIKARPKITITVQGQNKIRPLEVPLSVEAIENWIATFLPDKTAKEEQPSQTQEERKPV